MGNLAMCAPSIICNNAGVVKVLSSDGRLMVYSDPVRAAEIMLENPGQFLCESSYLRVGQRIPRVRAEEELESDQLYFLLPMELLYSVLTDEELLCLTNKASNGVMKQGAAGSLNISKIFPEFCLFPNASSSVDTSAADSHHVGRYFRQRSWQPALETIVETPAHI